VAYLADGLERETEDVECAIPAWLTLLGFEPPPNVVKLRVAAV
jgi:hypothetical protein